MSLPLAGVRVVEICQIASGPYCAMLLADLGADVIKIEPPGGDAMRAWPPLTNGFSENFAALNRNKRSIALDLRDPPDLAIARRLIGTGDVVIENSRPGAMRRLGLDYPVVAAGRPQLIYCSISAFGQTGPRSADGGFDVTLQAADGHFVIAAGNDRLWRSVCDVIGEPRLATEPRFASTSLRAQHQGELAARLEPTFAARPVGHWLGAFRAAGVPCEPINTYSAALADAQVAHLGLVQAMTLGNGAATRTVGAAVALPGARAPLRGPPALDADRAGILAELDRLAAAATRQPAT